LSHWIKCEAAMPVTIPLMDVLTVPGSAPLWPVDLRAQLDRLEETPDDRTAWAVLGDFFEDRLDEPEMARACRYVARKAQIKVVKEPYGWWRISGAPYSLSGPKAPDFDRHCLAGVLAEFAWLLDAAIRDLQGPDPVRVAPEPEST
jgi:hypothetical protein